MALNIRSVTLGYKGFTCGFYLTRAIRVVGRLKLRMHCWKAIYSNWPTASWIHWSADLRLHCPVCMYFHWSACLLSCRYSIIIITITIIIIIIIMIRQFITHHSMAKVTTRSWHRLWNGFRMHLCVCASVCLYVCLSVYLSIHPSFRRALKSHLFNTAFS